jgi:hypothetical protein
MHIPKKWIFLELDFDIPEFDAATLSLNLFEEEFKMFTLGYSLLSAYICDKTNRPTKSL